MPISPKHALVALRRNLLSILFPVGVTWAIYSDWSRTQAYKARKAQVALKAAEQLTTTSQ
jgi:hypothetical protein